MLAVIRAFAKSWVAAVLIGLLIVSFAVFGVSDVFRTRAKNEVVHAGSRVITPAEFRTEWDRAKQNVEQQSGQQISNELAVENRLDVRVLEMLADREAMAALIDKIGIRPADALVTREIQQIPAFFDPISGRFDKRLYQEALGRANLTPARFERSVRDDIAQAHLASGVVDGLGLRRRPRRRHAALPAHRRPADRVHEGQFRAPDAAGIPGSERGAVQLGPVRRAGEGDRGRHPQAVRLPQGLAEPAGDALAGADPGQGRQQRPRPGRPARQGRGRRRRRPLCRGGPGPLRRQAAHGGRRREGGRGGLRHGQRRGPRGAGRPGPGRGQGHRDHPRAGRDAGGGPAHARGRGPQDRRRREGLRDQPGL